MSRKPVVLMILDGYGLNKEKRGNAVLEANTPVMDRLMKECPFVEGNASGLAVGLPDGQMGNSEVGHLNMGAGRIVYQELTKITKAIEDGDFFENSEFLKAVENCKKNGSALHLMGLVSDGGVHSHMTHIFGLLELARRNGLDKVFVHCFLDGRDTPPSSGREFVEALEGKMKELGVGKVASVMGRYYAMDRDNRWDRVQKAYDVLTKGEGETAESAVAAMEASYAKDVTDEFFVPTAITENGKPVATIKDKDTVIFFNFRPDRAGELFLQGQVHHGAGVHHELHRDALYHGHPPAGGVRGDGMGRPSLRDEVDAGWLRLLLSGWRRSSTGNRICVS